MWRTQDSNDRDPSSRGSSDDFGCFKIEKLKKELENRKGLNN